MMEFSRCVFLWFVTITVKGCISPVNSEPQIITPNYLRNGGCNVATTQCPKWTTENCSIRLVYDKCGLCKTCPRLEGQSCGGPYYMYGVCALKKLSDNKALVPKNLYCIKNGQIIDQKLLTRGVNITGVCKPKACGKDCSKTALDWKCGSDGQWRRNLCFLNQANCNLKHGEKSIKNRHNTELCGPIPTATTAPGSTSSQREPMSSLEIYSPLEPIILTTTNIPVPTPSEVQTRNGNAIIL